MDAGLAISIWVAANRVTVAEGGAFYAQDRVDLGAAGLLRIDGDLYLGGTAYLAKGKLTAATRASDLRVTSNVSQTTEVTGSLSFGRRATYTPDVYFLQSGAAGGASDLINVSKDATISGTVRPVLQMLERTLPLVLIDAGGVTADRNTTVIGTAVMSYEIGLNGATGDGSTIDLIAKADFQLPGMNRNQDLTAGHIGRVLAGRGSVQMGPMFALIANMQTRAEVIDAIDRLGSQDYAATQVDALYSGQRFARSMASCEVLNVGTRMDDPGSCYWVNGIASRSERQASTDYRHFQTSATNFSGGMRMPVADDLYLGFGAGFEDLNMTSGDRFAAEGRRAELGVSLLKQQGAWDFYGIISGSTGKYHAARQIGIAGTLPNGTAVVADAVKADQRVNQANIRLGAAYRHAPEGSDFYLRPGIDLDASYLHSASTSERGSDYGLELRSTGQWALSVTPSLEMGMDVSAGDGNRVRAFLRGEASFANRDDVYVNATFPGASGSDGVFRNYSRSGDRTQRLKAGVTFYNDDQTGYMSVGYEGEWSRGSVGHAASLNIGMRF